MSWIHSLIKSKWRKAAVMPINHEEIIEDIEAHIRKIGGGFGEWCVGTAKNSRGQFFRRHLATDLGDGLIYREAFTTSAAEQGGRVSGTLSFSGEAR